MQTLGFTVLDYLWQNELQQKSPFPSLAADKRAYRREVLFTDLACINHMP